MDGYNLFEPDLELDVNTIPYEDMGIQGVWPRKQRTPSDVFPANANLIARGEDNKARWCKADKDGILYTHSLGGGGGASPVAIVPYDFSQSTNGNGDTDLGPMGPLGSTIFGYVFSWTYDAGSIRSPGKNAYVRLTIFGGRGSTYNFYLASIAISIPASGTTDRIAGEVNKWLYPGITFPQAQNQGDGKYHLYLQEVNIGGGNMTVNIWQDQ